MESKEHVETIEQQLNQAIVAIYHAGQAKSLEEFKFQIIYQLESLLDFSEMSWTVNNQKAELLLSGAQVADGGIDEKAYDLAIKSERMRNLQQQIKLSSLNYNFSEQQRQIVQVLLPHINQSFLFHIRSYLTRSECRGCRQAIYSRNGMLLFAEDGYDELLNLNQLAKKIQQQVIARGSIFSQGNLIVELQWHDELCQVDVTVMPNELQSLTAKELQVAYLISRLMSNKMIADSMTISVKTLENHLTKIYQKLMIKSRSELISFLHQASQ